MLSKNPPVDLAKALAHHEFKKNYDFDVLEQASLVNLTEQEAIPLLVCHTRNERLQDTQCLNLSWDSVLLSFSSVMLTFCSVTYYDTYYGVTEKKIIVLLFNECQCFKYLIIIAVACKFIIPNLNHQTFADCHVFFMSVNNTILCYTFNQKFKNDSIE